MKVSLSNQGGESGSLSSMALKMLSRLKRSWAEAGSMTAFGSCSCHQSISSLTLSWLLMSILLMISITGQSMRESFSMYSTFLSAFSTVSVT